jgi:hypothetical protein
MLLCKSLQNPHLCSRCVLGTYLGSKREGEVPLLSTETSSSSWPWSCSPCIWSTSSQQSFACPCVCKNISLDREGLLDFALQTMSHIPSSTKLLEASWKRSLSTGGVQVFQSHSFAREIVAANVSVHRIFQHVVDVHSLVWKFSSDPLIACLGS